MKLDSGRRKALALALGMGSASALAEWARPTILDSDRRPGFKLEHLVPPAFGAWQIDRHMPVILPPPDQQALLNKIYNQTLARTYVQPNGYRVMLSLAYGGDQSDGLTVHVPEVCYVGQGFRLERSADSTLSFGQQRIRVRQLVTTLGARHEPITYWVTIGDQATITMWERRLVSLRYGLVRRIPDGLLVRVSSIDRDYPRAFAQQALFLQDLVATQASAQRELFVGSVSL